MELSSPPEFQANHMSPLISLTALPDFLQFIFTSGDFLCHITPRPPFLHTSNLQLSHHEDQSAGDSGVRLLVHLETWQHLRSSPYCLINHLKTCRDVGYERRAPSVAYADHTKTNSVRTPGS